MTTLYFDTYRDLQRVFGEVATPLATNPMVAKISYANGSESIRFKDGYTLRFKVVTAAGVVGP